MTALGVAFVLALQAPAMSAEDVHQWLQCYSRTPRPELALAAIQIMDREFQVRQGWPIAHEAHAAWRTFFAKVFAANPQVAAEAGARLNTMPEGVRVFVAASLRRCGTTACIKALPSGGVREPVDEPNFSVMDAGVLGSWAAFAATGDAKYVREVIDVVRSGPPRTDTDPLRGGGTADLSLISGAHQDRRVLSTLEAEAAATSEPGKTVLRNIIKLAKAERSRRPVPDPPCTRRPTKR